MISRWLPPKGKNVKVNFDAAFKLDQHRSCSRFVIRNEFGLISKHCSPQVSNNGVYKGKHYVLGRRVNFIFAVCLIACFEYNCTKGSRV
ncbi:hypothetical protein Gogos_005636 [Gossypium gossypioides]|uniref:Uncharacterized protein n=1 Tax=Gossypium gossypioides TaxID=34282 RepID=A0A7J9D863_GOSGO|nr:hypothetical protein [Gossypium gossypioides]